MYSLAVLALAFTNVAGIYKWQPRNKQNKNRRHEVSWALVGWLSIQDRVSLVVSHLVKDQKKNIIFGLF